jgi:hypothetical protein
MQVVLTERAGLWGRRVGHVMRACWPLLQDPVRLQLRTQQRPAFRITRSAANSKTRRVHSHRGESKPQGRGHCIVPASSVARNGTESPGGREPGRSGGLPQRRSAATTRTHRCSVAEEAAHGRLCGVVDLRGHGGDGLRQARARERAKRGDCFAKSAGQRSVLRGGKSSACPRCMVNTCNTRIARAYPSQIARIAAT